MTPRAIPVAGVKPDAGSYSHVAAAWGGLLFVPGQVGVDGDGALVGDDAASEARQGFRNLEQVLGAAGAGLDALAKLTVCVTDAAHAADVARVRTELLEPPCSAVVAAGSLDPASKVEIEAIAVAVR